jgi:parallel beta-helix repeat protein
MSIQKVRQAVRKPNICAALTRILVAGLLVLLVGPVTPARADTSVCGPIDTDTTWNTAGNNYFITCLTQVMPGVTLTIEPGVRVYFNAGTNLRIDGTLIAEGVTFGSSDATPAPGDWGRIFFMALSEDAVFDANGNYLSGSIIKDSVVVYGGGGFEGSVIAYGASPYLTGNSVGLSASYGYYLQGRSASQPVQVNDSFVYDNNGGGVYVTSGQVISTTVQGNSGRGVYAIDSELIDNTITENTGGGIYAEDSTITGNTVTGNSANSSGGGIQATGGAVEGNEVSGNSLSTPYTSGGFYCGGGIYASAATVSKNTVAGNHVIGGGFWNQQAGGAGICAFLSDLTDNTVTDNSVGDYNANAFGGGIYSDGSILSQNLVSGNSVSGASIGYGGGIYANGGTVSENTVDNNVAVGSGNSQGGGIYGDISAVQENSLTGNSANLGGAVYAYKGSVTNNSVLTNTTALSGTLYIDQGTATLNVLKGNNAVAGGAIFGVDATLAGNTAEGNSANYGAGIYAQDSTVLGNTLSGNAATTSGGGIYASGGEVTNNNLTANTVPSWGHGSGAYLAGVTDFTYNSVLTNTASGGGNGGVAIDGQPLFQYNNLYGNQPYDVEVLSTQDVTGTLNYWGLSPCNTIPLQIYDGKDVPGRGELIYAPSLYSPVPVTQLAAPTDLAIDIGDSEVTLSWTPIPPIPNVGCRVPNSNEPDLTYLLYYDTNQPCPPYDGNGLPQGDSPIEVTEGASLTLSGLSQAGYYFAVTAHDYLGRESAYSNIAEKPSTVDSFYLPLIEK